MPSKFSEDPRVSDEKPHEVGSRRRRREIREARERAAAAEREREEAFRRRRLSFEEALREEGENSADRKSVSMSEGQKGRGTPNPVPAPVKRSRDEVFDQTVFDQSPSVKTLPDQTQRADHIQRADQAKGPDQPSPKPVAEPKAAEAAESERSAQSPAVTPAAPFEAVVAPHLAPSPQELSSEHGDDQHGESPEDQPDEQDVHEEGYPRDFLDDHVENDDLFDERIEHDEDGTPLLISSSSYGRGYQTVTPVASDVSRSVLKRRRQRRRRRNLTLATALAGFAVLVIGFVWIVGAWLGGGGPEDYDQVAGDTVEFTVEEGDVPGAVFNRLVEQEIVASEDALNEAWQQWQATGGDTLLRVGDFALYEEMPAEDAIIAIFDAEEAAHFFSIDSGLRIEEALDRIAEQTGLDRRELNELNENPQQFDLPEEAETLEGYLAVGEYSPSIEATAEEVLQESVDRTFEQLDELGIEGEDAQWETIIKASLVTAEAHYDADGGDYDTIAGAIENRLDEVGDEDSETAGFLQIDAAVIYGLDVQRIHFTDEEREDDSNEYNTYQRPGLTPGPIEAPHPAALEAVADPDENDYLYWVTVNLETGETLFAETYPEHQNNVEELNQYCEENSEICSGEPAGEQTEAVEPGE